jgi:hypothetical protein
MTRFTFSLSKAGVASDAGAVISDSFMEALDALSREPAIAVGDTIEIGVPGFPPARYECIPLDPLRRGFQPVRRLAA